MIGRLRLGKDQIGKVKSKDKHQHMMENKVVPKLTDTLCAFVDGELARADTDVVVELL